MILKEAYRYANYLERLAQAITSYLGDSDITFRTKSTHMRAVATNGRIEDIVEEDGGAESFNAAQLIDLAVQVQTEREKLADAIRCAKVDALSVEGVDVDQAVSVNKMKRDLVDALNELSGLKSSESITSGTDYVFNAVDGKQQQYRYAIKKVATIDFDRNNVRALAKKYARECDEMSTVIDRINIMTNVNYEPLWDVDTTVERIFDTE